MKSIVVTGVSTGIGHGTADELCRRGFRVFGSVRTEEDAARLQHTFGDNFTPLVFDVTDVDAIGRAAATVQDQMDEDGLFGLVNNAGISVPGPLSALPPDTLRRHFEINVVGVLHMVQAFLPLLRKTTAGRPGRIVNISSVSGRIAYPFMGAYAASKAGVHRLTESLAEELKGDRITVNAVLPSILDTPANRADMPKADPALWVSPAELSAVILFLASEAASAVTGALVPVTGRV